MRPSPEQGSFQGSKAPLGEHRVLGAVPGCCPWVLSVGGVPSPPARQELGLSPARRGGRNKAPPSPRGQYERVCVNPSTDLNETRCRFVHSKCKGEKGGKKKPPKIFFLNPRFIFFHPKIHFSFLL